MALTPDEIDLIQRMRNLLSSRERDDIKHLRYREGEARVEHLGMAIPQNMRDFMVFVSWCDTLVTGHTDRQQVRYLSLPGEDTADPQLRAIWDASNMDAKVPQSSDDSWTFGRSFWTVGTNESDSSRPLIRAESPREMVAIVDARTETMRAACRFYGTDEHGVTPTNVTLYLPNQTIWIERQQGRWVEVGRDVHNLGVVPVIMHLHRNRVGEWAGRSGLAPLIPYVDSATRSFTNMQFAQEAHGIPRMWMAGVGRGDFVDADGKPIPMFEAYFDAIHMLRDANAKVGQLSAADLKNFETSISIAAKQASSVTKMPPDYFGITTTNPAGEGAIRASEARLIRSVEAQNTQMGVSLGWVGALALRFATGEWVQGNRIKVEWFDPATPTVAQRMDAIAKAKAQGILSREGAWDELGWSEARKNREREYFQREESAVLAADLSFLNKPVPDGAADSPAGD